MNVPYVRRMIPKPGDADREVPVNETFYEQTDDELTEKELKQVEADDQAIQTILLCLPEDIFADVDKLLKLSGNWLRVQQMMKGDWVILDRNCIVDQAEGGYYADSSVQLLIAHKEEQGIQNPGLKTRIEMGIRLTRVPIYDSAKLHHLKTNTSKNCLDSISVTRTQTKTIIDSLQKKLHDTIYENAKLRAQLFDKVSEQKDTTKGTSVNTQFCKQSILGEKPTSSSKPKLLCCNYFPKSKGLPKIDETHALSKPVTSNSVPTPPESKVVKNDNVIARGMFRINHFKSSKEKKFVPNTVRASVRTNSNTVSQPHDITKKGVNSNLNGLSFTGVDNTVKTRRPQPRSNTKNDRVPSASKSSCFQNKEAEVEEHPRNLLLSKNKKHMSSECNNNFLGTIRFGNDHVAAILGFGDLQWGNILITMVYFIEGLGHNLFSIGQFCDSDLEVSFRRNTCFVKNLEGVDLLKGNRTTNLYTTNLHEMASSSIICLIAHDTSTKSWLWHQRLSHLNFDTINDLTKNDLVTGLPKFKYHKEHLCHSYEQGKIKRASHPPKPVPNSKQRLHLLHMDFCGPMRIASINGKRDVLVIVDDYSRYTWVHFLISKDETLEVIKTFLNRINVLLQSPIIIIRTDNGT
ncbi:retrovirus-related pol polyprotein from transposon TNT 1-94 [Tanacetum coccineum]